ncbi:toxic anion resistance protein [Luteimonas deserti]|uniref:Toxic anion resistance protein n=1 Tax=Luteimonas deserti TaxID=2752306 RepID=A0A7Z0TYM5_9GAMM|nr:toxic anion resistance protein [Luteimonas deserti]NYZ62527.1 toxic anion resistance protein [Luteimonas deserti]
MTHDTAYPTHVPSATPVTDDAALQSLGLVPADRADIEVVGRSLEDITPGNLHVFGRDAASKTAAFSSQLLDQVRNSDLDATGEKLGEVVRIARSLDLGSFAGRSKVPLLGRLIDKMRAGRDELVQTFSSTNQQIERLMGDVGRQQDLLTRRISDFDRMHDVVLEERRALGVHVVAGRERLARLAAEQTTLAGAEDPQSRTRRAEIENAIRLLDKRVGDLLVMQHAADQSLPMIRLIQANAIQLVEKFNTVRNITIPSWKRQFAIQLSLGEQKNAVELSNAIDDATNELMRSNADLLRQTSVETAKANQRAVIDIGTLRHVHEQLIQTVEEVRSIHRDGMQQRREAEGELARLRDDVQKRLAAPTDGV